MGCCSSCCCSPAETTGDEALEPFLQDEDDDEEDEDLTNEGAGSSLTGLGEKRWYHGKISHREAEARLREGAGGNDGSYLVYDNPNEKGFILLVYYKGDLVQRKIRNRQPGSNMSDSFILGDGGPGYKTVRKLIKAHRGVFGRPIMLESGETVTLSKSYVFVAD